jgi:hypothetical protein
MGFLFFSTILICAVRLTVGMPGTAAVRESRYSRKCNILLYLSMPKVITTTVLTPMLVKWDDKETLLLVDYSNNQFYNMDGSLVAGEMAVAVSDHLEKNSTPISYQLPQEIIDLAQINRVNLSKEAQNVRSKA